MDSLESKYIGLVEFFFFFIIISGVKTQKQKSKQLTVEVDSRGLTLIGSFVSATLLMCLRSLCNLETQTQEGRHFGVIWNFILNLFYKKMIFLKNY